MSHARQAIVSAVAAALADLPSTGSRVYQGRSWPLRPDDGAYLLIYGRREVAQPISNVAISRRMERQLALVVEGWSAGAVDDDAVLDGIAAEVEAAITTDPTLGGAVRDLWLVRTDIDVTTSESEQRLGRVRLEFAVTYHTRVPDPTVAA